MINKKIENTGIEFKNINFSLENTEILKNISGIIPKGKISSIVGPSGSGKTTLIHILSGLICPNSGLVLMNGDEVEDVAENVGVVFQDYSLFPWLTVFGNVSFGKNIRKLNKEKRNDKIKKILKSVGLWEQRNKFPHQLSGGMQQRVSIARTIANDAEYIFMDEPFGALDYQTKIRMHDFILKIWKELNKTIILITHNIDEAIQISDKIFLLPLEKNNKMKKIEVDLPRPRDIYNPKFQEYKKEILEHLEEEVIF